MSAIDLVTFYWNVVFLLCLSIFVLIVPLFVVKCCLFSSIEFVGLMAILVFVSLWDQNYSSL